MQLPLRISAPCSVPKMASSGSSNDFTGRSLPSAESANRYYICLDFADAAPIPWPLYGEQPADAPDYFTRTFRAMERHLHASGLTVYLTWRLDRLPTTGKDVVAIVLGDEWGRLPAYSNDILATFKTYGSLPALDVDWTRIDRLNTLRLLKQIRTYFHYIPGLARHAKKRLQARLRDFSSYRPPPIYDCPLGYGNQLDLPIRPMADRSVDLFFAGSIEHDGGTRSLRTWFENPKAIARRSMLRNVETLQATRPDLTIDLAISSTFVLNALHYDTEVEGRVLKGASYSESMMNTKVCLIPRGTSPETFRFFEALRYGCVLITETLPQRWFYDGSPAIQLRSWNDLPAVVDRLFQDPALLAQKQKDALRWWDRVCSPDAVGRYFADKINLQRLRS